MIETLQDEIYQLGNNQAKGAKLRSYIRWELEGENVQRYFSKYFKERICKIKQYLNYMLIIMNQNVLLILRTFSNLQKKLYKKPCTKETTSKAATTEFLDKILNRKKIFNEQFKLCEAKIFSDKIIKSINSQTNNKSPNNDGLTAEFYKHFSNELTPVLLAVWDS